ncbi:hypothetical protein [Halovalidus salilacus]|uniref:hypothetical protein n=1 Tax=Halovalidus salilacus TaxID=3075124 RepID=UPI00361D7F4F
MGSLKVFDSQGRAMYPAGASDENQMQRYFDQDILAIGPKNDKYKIEAYLKVKTSERNEQVSIRYIGDTLDTLFADCRAAIRTQLVENRGWTIREPYGNGPGKLTWLTIWEGIGEANANKTPDDLYADSEFGLGLNREERSLLQSIVREENGTVRITASDYDVIAKALSQYLTTGNTIVVSRERHSPPEYADIHLSVSSDQWENFTLHDETRETLERLKEQRREELRQESFSDLAETIASLKELNADKSAVKDRLSTAQPTPTTDCG